MNPIFLYASHKFSGRAATSTSVRGRPVVGRPRRRAVGSERDRLVAQLDGWRHRYEFKPIVKAKPKACPEPFDTREDGRCSIREDKLLARSWTVTASAGPDFGIRTNPHLSIEECDARGLPR